MLTIKLICDVDFCDDYNYIIDFNQYYNGIGIPIFILNEKDKEFDISKFKQSYKKILDNIPNLKYKYDNVNSKQNNSEKYELIKIKYYNKCNKRILLSIIQIIEEQNIKAYSYDEVYVLDSYLQTIKFSHSKLQNSSIYTRGKLIEKFKNLNKTKEFKVFFIKNGVKQESLLTLSLLKDIDEPENKLYLRYDKDEAYWTLKRTKQIKETEPPQLTIINKELNNIRSKLDLSELRKINIDNFTSNTNLQTKGFSDNVKYIYELFKKVFNYLNSNNEEIKKMVIDLQTVILELKELYSNLEIKQNELEISESNHKSQMELYEKSLPKSEQKKLEEERRKKAKEEKKLEEEKKMKLEETKKAIDSLNMIASMCGADLSNDPDMKDILNMYGSITKAEKQNEEKKEEEKEEKDEKN